MKKISINYFNEQMVKGKNAGNKARSDCSKILKKFGYDDVHIFVSKTNWIRTVISLAKTSFLIKRNSNVIIQYPLSKTSCISSFIINVCKIKQCQLSFLIHDLDSLRNIGHLSRMEICFLQKADNLIVHNDKMCNLLKPYIPNTHFFILQAFDYLVNQSIENCIFDDIVVYAGNFKKSKFLESVQDWGIKVNLYGVQTSNLNILCGNNVKYQGVFQPDDLSVIKGSWGLVWDGISAMTCDGMYGKYLKYNAPHKLSLYIAAKLPIIIWDQAAEADFIINNKLGIVIHSLYEIKDMLANISQEEYLILKKNVAIYSERLKKGENLTDILKQLDSSN